MAKEKKVLNNVVVTKKTDSGFKVDGHDELFRKSKFAPSTHNAFDSLSMGDQIIKLEYTVNANGEFVYNNVSALVVSSAGHDPQKTIASSQKAPSPSQDLRGDSIEKQVALKCATKLVEKNIHVLGKPVSESEIASQVGTIYREFCKLLKNSEHITPEEVPPSDEEMENLL